MKYLRLEYYLKMNKIYYILFVLLFAGCSSGVGSYVDWYNKLKPYSIIVGGGSVVLKEVPADIIYIQTHPNKGDKKELELFREKINVRHLTFEYKKTETGVYKNQLYGKDLECAIDGIPPLDKILEISKKGIPAKVTFIFDKKTFDTGKQIQIAHPEIKDIIQAEMAELRLNNKRKLQL